MIPWMAVAVGGALGSLARHGVTALAQRYATDYRMPWGTFVVNVAGCLVAGLLAGLLASGRLSMRHGWREFVFVGLLGGFTTFSAFGLETFALMRSGELPLAIANVSAQVGVGLLGLYVGFSLAAR